MMTSTRRGQFCNFAHEVKPTMLMVVVQVAFAGINVLYKLAVNDGMNLNIVVAYRFIFSAAFMVPVALIFEWGKRPKMTWTLLFQTFLCGLFGGSLGQNLYLQSLILTSATFVSASTNLIPAITFIFAICFRLEKLEFKKATGKAKVLGTLIGIAGAMLLTFYKGFVINFLKTNVDLLSSSSSDHCHMSPPHSGKHLLGASLSLGSCFSYAFGLIIQTKMSERYTCYYTSTALMSIMGSIQAVVFALSVERDWTQWKLGWNIRLWTVAYSGIVGSGLTVTLISWCVRVRGPLFVSSFNPLMLVLVALSGALFLEEKLYLGSVLGAILIICGLYTILWGKSQEMKQMRQLVPSRTLQNVVNVVIESPRHTKVIEKENALSPNKGEDVSEVFEGHNNNNNNF